MVYLISAFCRIYHTRLIKLKHWRRCCDPYWDWGLCNCFSEFIQIVFYHLDVGLHLHQSLLFVQAALTRHPSPRVWRFRSEWITYCVVKSVVEISALTSISLTCFYAVDQLLPWKCWKIIWNLPVSAFNSFYRAYGPRAPAYRPSCIPHFKVNVCFPVYLLRQAIIKIIGGYFE